MTANSLAFWMLAKVKLFLFLSYMLSEYMKSEREVAQSCPTPTNPMDCSLPGSSVQGICQARVLEWGAIAFSARGR